MVPTLFRVKGNFALVIMGNVGRMSRSPNAPEGRTAAPEGRAPRLGVVAAVLLLSVTGTVAARAAETKAPASTAVLAKDNPNKLTLENAVPLAVPPAPDLRTPPPVKVMPRFVAPTVLTAPPAPDVVIADPPPPPPAPAGAPPVKTANWADGSPQRSTLTAPSAGAAASGQQTAALPPTTKTPHVSTSLGKADLASIRYDGATAALSDKAEAELADIAQRMTTNPYLRLELKSFADGTPDTLRQARQLSLSRALAVRDRLASLGIPSNRVDIRALGFLEGDTAPDRIDLEFSSK